MSSKNFGVVWMDYRRDCAERPEKGYPHACEFEVAADRSRIVQHPPQPADCATPSSITCVSACATAPVKGRDGHFTLLNGWIASFAGVGRASGAGLWKHLSLLATTLSK